MVNQTPTLSDFQSKIETSTKFHYFSAIKQPCKTQHTVALASIYKMIIRTHKPLIILGCLLWVAGFFMAAGTIYPFSLIGIYIGPILLFLGIIGWTINYRRTKNRFPNPIRSFKAILSKHKGLLKYHLAMFQFMFSYLLHFWTFCIVFWIALSFFGTTLFKNSSAFSTTKKYVETDKELIDKVGPIKYYGFLIGGSISSSGNADISFSIIGENGTVNANSILENGRVVTVKYN